LLLRRSAIALCWRAAEAWRRSAKLLRWWETLRRRELRSSLTRLLWRPTKLLRWWETLWRRAETLLWRRELRRSLTGLLWWRAKLLLRRRAETLLRRLAESRRRRWWRRRIPCPLVTWLLAVVAPCSRRWPIGACGHL